MNQVTLAKHSYETSVDFQQAARYYIPGDESLHNRHCENFRSYVIYMYVFVWSSVHEAQRSHV